VQSQLPLDDQKPSLNRKSLNNETIRLGGESSHQINSTDLDNITYIECEANDADADSTTQQATIVDAKTSKSNGKY
jgi:hypothetical protein